MVKRFRLIAFILLTFSTAVSAIEKPAANPTEHGAVLIAQPQFSATALRAKPGLSLQSARFEGLSTLPARMPLRAIQEGGASTGTHRTAFLKSLLLPGWGQHTLGAKTSARTFILSEIVLIGTSLGFNVYSNWLENDFSAFAERHAGVQNAESKDDQFWVDIGNFDSVVDYNDEKLRQRNTIDLRDVHGEDAWQWSNETNREIFEDMRIRRDRAAERSAFMIAGIVANHVISAVHAIWLNKKANASSAQQAASYHFRWENTPQNDGGRLRLSYQF